MNTLLKPIICCGFTPCVQRIIEFEKFEESVVNRASRVTIGIGGKGANTARMVKQLGRAARLVGFVGGANGALIEALLDREGVGYRHISVEGETRICQTLVERGNPETTELVEEMPAISEAEWVQMQQLFEEEDLSGAIVAISGKLPAGAPVDAYAQICERVRRCGGQVVIDAPAEPLLLSVEQKPAVVKINDVELLATVDGEDLIESSRELIRRGAGAVLITRGGRSAFYVDSTQAIEFFPPKIEAVNAVGSGDAVTAGLAVELSRGIAIPEAFATGMACGAANALSLISGQLDPLDVERLRGEVRMQVLN